LDRSLYQQVRDAILNGGDAKSSLSGKTVTGRRLNVFNTLNLLSSATVTVNGDENGAATADTILCILEKKRRTPARRLSRSFDFISELFFRFIPHRQRGPGHVQLVAHALHV
jgi:hypothetical protein